ncbi:MAG: PEP-CTERM sorting domain-containing protein [Verrucomicrobiales bacterium]|nr:PEP-CTERM sorting domain-containing protein [Verrucomicrobiales bacterium]
MDPKTIKPSYPVFIGVAFLWLTFTHQAKSQGVILDERGFTRATATGSAAPMGFYGMGYETISTEFVLPFVPQNIPYAGGLTGLIAIPDGYQPQISDSATIPEPGSTALLGLGLACLLRLAYPGRWHPRLR